MHRFEPLDPETANQRGERFLVFGLRNGRDKMTRKPGVKVRAPVADHLACQAEVREPARLAPQAERARFNCEDSRGLLVGEKFGGTGRRFSYCNMFAHMPLTVRHMARLF